MSLYNRKGDFMFCPKCGSSVSDDTKVCPNCDYIFNEDDIIDVECTDETIKEESIYKKTDYMNSENGNNVTLSNAVKVLLVAVVVLLNGLGAIIGIVSGIYFMSKPYPDYNSFGRILLSLSILMLVISFICCCISGVFGMFSYI